MDPFLQEYLERLGAREIVDGDHGQPLALGPGHQSGHVLVMPEVLVAVGDHRTTAVPPATTHDVNLGGQKGVGGDISQICFGE